MAFFGKALKADLQKLAESLGIEVGASTTVNEIKRPSQAILNYDEEVDYIKELLETLKATQLEEEKKAKRFEEEKKKIER
ncbi:hypothetical protein AVEN_218575-1 [Araneus ventricosus]|uniref:Uncharacterized protein n=1 Tax=Araneus ventricosus TaxID=182803 RepID=A0A4Y2T3V8_ARAVE|nr:hypothetical protein AVEN_218575-1 [Araneus ventricosus]